MNEIYENIEIKSQENKGDYQFNGELLVSAGFRNLYGNEAIDIARTALNKVRRERVPHGADFFQVFKYLETFFWMIDDVNVVKVLIPEDYEGTKIKDEPGCLLLHRARKEKIWDLQV